MENTSPFLFDDTDEKYFLALQGKALGPMTAQEVYERVQKGDASLMHYVWCEGWDDWKRLGEDRAFAILLPQKPTDDALKLIRERLARARSAAKKGNMTPPAMPPLEDDTKNTYLYFNRSQYGPFSHRELAHVLKSHKIDRSAYLWVPGWPNWKRITEVSAFASLLTAPRVPTEKTISKAIGAKDSQRVDSSERRGGPRKPLVARLFLHDDKEVIVAVCRDISVGGMQVLTDRVPGPAGTHVKLNVSPGAPERVKGFVAEGEIVRVLEDGRGFSFRFTKIGEEARKAIARYIKS